MMVVIIFIILFSMAWAKSWVMAKLWELETKRNRTNLNEKALIQAYNSQIESLIKMRRQWMI